MVASMAAALNQAQNSAEPEARMKLALLEMHGIANEKFRRASRNTVGVISNEMIEVMFENPRFMKAFILEYAQWTMMLNAKMNRFCEMVYRDMKNSSRKDDAGSGVHHNHESQALFGPTPSPQNEREAIQKNIDCLTFGGPSPSSPDRDGGVPLRRESQVAHGAAIPTPIRSGDVHSFDAESQAAIGPSAAASNRNDAVQQSHVSQASNGRVVPMPNKPSPQLRAYEASQNAAAINVQKTMRDGLAEWYKCKRSDGVPWPKTGWHELDGLDRDGALSRAIKRRVSRPLNQFEILENLMTPAQFKECQDEAQRANG